MAATIEVIITTVMKIKLNSDNIDFDEKLIMILMTTVRIILLRTITILFTIPIM